MNANAATQRLADLRAHSARRAATAGAPLPAMRVDRAAWLCMLVVLGALMLVARPADAGVAGCCRCTGCASPELFACRAALDADSCDSTCSGLGCSSAEFMNATDCLDVPTCFGDCCDDQEGGCSQVPQASCTGGNLYFANSFCDASNCLAQPPTATVTNTPTITATATVTATPVNTATATATASATPSVTPTLTHTAANTPTHTAADTPTSTPVDTATSTPQDTATATPTDSTPPSATPTDTPDEPTATATETPADTPTSTPSQAATDTPTSEPTFTATATETTAPETPTPTPTETAIFTPTATAVVDALEWIIDETTRTSTLMSIPVTGASYRRPPARPALQLHDDDGRFCVDAGLAPVLRLDLPPEVCENECFLGYFRHDTPTTVDIARLPAVLGPGGTFDLVIATRAVCEPGAEVITLRMSNAISYVFCVGDCDADGDTEVHEIMLGVAAALGETSSSSCRAHDVSGDGEVTVDELLAAVSSLLNGCDAP